MSKILKNSNGKVVLDNVNANIIMSVGGQPTPTGETLVINENPSSDVNITRYINYKSNNITYSVIYIEAVPMGCQITYNNNTVHTSAPPMGDSIWFDENGNQTTYALTPYKTVTFETAPTVDLLTWLQANAVKQ